MNLSQPTPAAPPAFYTARRETLLREVAQRRRQHMWLGYVRLLWAGAMLAIAWFAFWRHALHWEWLFLPWFAFALTAHFHARVLAAGARCQRAVAWCNHGLARIEDRWAGLRPRTPGVDVAASLHAADLDLFGPGSLFELLCLARTSLGQDTLAGWLLAPALHAEVLARQVCVADLQHGTALREAWASAAGPDLLPIDRDALLRWAEGPPLLPAALRWGAPLLTALTLAAVARWAVVHSPLFLLAMIALDIGAMYLLRAPLDALLSEAQQASRRLSLLADLLGLLEQATFTAPRLRAAQADLRRSALPASAAIRRLARLSVAANLRGNLFRLVDIPTLYSVHLGLLVQRWRRAHGASLRGWLETLGEFEALLSLSNYHFEHPKDTFPELVEGEPVFVASELGHPLLPQATCVRNDVALGMETRLLLVSGSNMSGKSTLLRAVGTAAVMAMAGAPVRARQLRLAAFHVAASIQVSDSLQGGRSRFYAEILRLRAICELAREQPPVLFLLDELLAGTNSHDRLAGASGIVQQLLHSGALGLLSTHDLALTGIEGSSRDLIYNTHFEDRIVDDQLVFDYKLREGIVTRSNGLELMRMIGLEV